MRLVIGSDHAGFPLKATVVAHLRQAGHEVADVGSFDPNPVDFPDIARQVAAAITGGKAERGIMVCGTGVGAALPADNINCIPPPGGHHHQNPQQSLEHY
jgi:ribose 5-phosphate isomerase B